MAIYKATKAVWGTVSAIHINYKWQLLFTDVGLKKFIFCC